jgi:signal transduction histidine kinase/AmiR/NasT family two-component response regulator
LLVDAARRRPWIDWLHTAADQAALVRSLSGGSATTGDLLKRIRLKEMNLAMQTLAGDALADSAAVGRLFDETCLAGLTEVLSRTRPGDHLPAFECRLLTPSGETREVSLRIHAVTGTRRPWETCLVTVVDVTEARQAAEAQSRALEAAESANRAKSEFLAVMSHEIRTPLNGVLGMAAALERSDLSDRQRAQIEVIGRSGQALLAILNDILDLSKIEAGKLEIELEPFRLEEVVADVRDAFCQIAAGKGLALTCDIAPEAHGDYVGDAVRIRQILTNLVSNAVKFTSQGHVRLSAEVVADGVRLSVEDTGIGVAPADQERLFERFIQADSTATRRFGGTGLGLAICRELCAALGGGISLTSEPGKGSRFTVELPLARHDPVPRPAPEAAVESVHSGTLRILAAEDNSMNQLVLRTLLQQLGIEPVIVPDGRAAVEACASQTFDLVLMDIQMPVLDGVAATREIRRHEAAVGRAPVPIVALTANVMSHQLYEYRTAGMDACVSKPIQFAELLETIDALTAPELSRESHDLRSAG